MTTTGKMPVRMGSFNVHKRISSNLIRPFVKRVVVDSRGLHKTGRHLLDCLSKNYSDREATAADYDRNDLVCDYINHVITFGELTIQITVYQLPRKYAPAM